MVETYSSASSTRRNFIFKNHENLDFWWNFKVSFLSRFWQFWANFAALAVADNMPKDHMKS
jgi:hypothetical protein